MPTLRYQPPDRLLGAARFSEDEDLRGSLNAVKLVKEQDWATDELRDTAAALESNYGRRRKPGRWELAYVAFVASGHVALQRWYDETTEEIWRECGFNVQPSYPTVNRRLHELESVEGAFLGAAATVIQRCIAHDPRVFAHPHVDSTEDETHARLVHDCQPSENCKRKVVTTKSGRQRAAPGYAVSPLRAPTSEAREEREKWNTEDPKDSEKLAKATEPKKTMTVWRNGRRVKRVRLSNGCWYRTRDTEAGVRLYKNGRFWHGYYHSVMIDHLTGGAIPLVESASKNESKLFPDLFDRTVTMTGRAPQTVTGDKGFSVVACFKHATSNGTAPVFPHRHGGHTRHDKLTHDRHGVPRCKYCGGPTRQIKFSANNGKPRVWVRCEDGKQTPDCAKQQTIYCETDWRAIVKLPRTEPLYHELKASHQPYEAVHRYDRERYLVGANDLGTRPRTVGIGPHRLRASAACLVNWLRIAAANNWLVDDVKRKLNKGVRRCKKAGEAAARILAKSRVKTGLAGAYGPQAAKLGIGDATPPSRRPPPGAHPPAGAPPPSGP
jgi:DDE family transposase